ncbi:MAG: glycosyl transferase [Terriglobia bacterium]|nr:MAG: glycosyl transferase [Terriglobia bacterium]
MVEYLDSWRDFFDHYAPLLSSWRRRNRGYHANIQRLACFYCQPQCRILEVGCGTGDLLAALDPSVGVGIDISGEMVRIAKANHPGLTFHHMAAEEIDLGDQKFDYIVLSDLAGFLFDIKLVFQRLRNYCHSGTRLVIHSYSRAWQPILIMAEKLRLKYPQPLLNWTTTEDIVNLLYLAGYESVATNKHIMLPLRMPVISWLCNRYLAHLPVLRHLCLTNWIVARSLGLPAPEQPSVSVICPCRNEAGNIEQVARRLPSLGSRTELIFVEGHSTDNTLAECRRVQSQFPDRNIRVLAQQGRGKRDAVELGFSQASGDIFMILDADLSVNPEDLEQFYEAVASGKGDLVNGCRLVYAMDPKAMRFLNLLGNKFFALLLSRFLGQLVKDTLCGTKVLSRENYERIQRSRSYFGDFDPFGDFDLLFGAAKLNLKIVEIPVRYRQRMYGTTNINRFRDGFLLLRMCRVAANKLYFVG